MTTQSNAVTKILFFASFRELIGQSAISIHLMKPTTVADLLDQLYAEHPQVKAQLAEREFLFAVNQQLATSLTLVQPGDELALFPFVTGG